MRNAFAAAVLLAGCAGADASGPSLRGPAAQVIVVHGDSQLGTVHQVLAAIVGVRVFDDRGKPLAGQSVSWKVVKGGGSVFAGAGITNDSGVASEQWTLGDTAGVQLLEARAVDSTGKPIVFARVTANANPGPVAYAGFTTRTLRLFGDSVLTLPLHATDAYGNTVAASVGRLDTIAFATSARADGRWPVRGLGRAQFVAGSPSETLTVIVSPPLGSFRAEYHNVDTVIVETGTIASVAIDTVGGPSLNTACYSYTGTGSMGRSVYTGQGIVSVRRVNGGTPDTVTMANFAGILHHVADKGGVWYSSARNALAGQVVCRSVAVAATTTARWQFNASAASIDSLTITP